MGSWDNSCNISNLPITSGTPVRVLFLGKKIGAMDPLTPNALGASYNACEGCDSTDFWYPRTVPLQAVYYDYGQVDKIEEGLSLKMF